MVRGRSDGGGKPQGGDLCEGRKMMATITEESKRSNTATRTSCSRERHPLSLAEAYKKETQMMNRESIHRIHSFLPLESALPAGALDENRPSLLDRNRSSFPHDPPLDRE